MKKFYDRVSELNVLGKNWLQSANQSMMTTLIGRRRIGKTSLLMKSIESQPHLYLYVSKDNESMLCSKFQGQISSQLGLDMYGRFVRFSEVFEELMKFGRVHHYTLIIDEFQNFQSVNPSIPSHIQEIWDRYKDTTKVNLILCGSIYSMMKRIFESGDEPLYGRRDSAMRISPFSTSTLKEILIDYNPDYCNEDLLCLFMLTGGVAKYVSLLMDSGSVTKDKMLDYVFSSDSPFLTEGTEMLLSEFGRDYGTYFSILQLIAAGMTTQTQIDGMTLKNTGAYLSNLHNDFSFIGKNVPILSKSGTRNIRWSINDSFLRFWFRFIYPYQNLIESGRLDILKKYVQENYETFSGRSLEDYFRSKIMEEGNYTKIGNWWDRKGEKEIDLVALNEFSRDALVCEIKRNPRKVSLSILQEKMKTLPKEFNGYHFEVKALSLEDM